ncbi:MAG TPA: hypothetical protein VKB67_04775 [Rhizomicrobium sp.]|nr:hypothetical protein [Rhizomicrobium sp.]
MMTGILPGLRRYPFLSSVALVLLIALAEIASGSGVLGFGGAIRETAAFGLLAYLVVYQFRHDGIFFGRSNWTEKKESPLAFWLVLGGESLVLAVGGLDAICDLIHL